VVYTGAPQRKCHALALIPRLGKLTLLHATGPVLLPLCLPAALRMPKDLLTLAPTMLIPDWAPLLTARLHTGVTGLYAEAMAVIERQVLTHVLRSTVGNNSQLLGMTRHSRATRYEHLALALNAPCAQQMTSLLSS
jgi:hypothetical protein